MRFAKSPLLPLGAAMLPLMIQCAGQIPPPGGPPDTEPPFVLRTVPDTNTVRVTEKSVLLEFSEYVDRRSVEEAIFVSPPLGALEFDWSGTEVEMQFEDTLRSNTTYVISVGTDVVDQRAGNRMAEGFSLAFSTGDSIDKGALTGRVYDKKPEGLLLFAYRLNDLNPDTINPSKLKPDYVMQTGKEGKFLLSNLAWGTYRILAVRDEYHNLLYDKQTDQYGVYVADVVLSAAVQKVNSISFRVTAEDTTAPFLSGVQALNNGLLRVRFSEPVDSIGFSASSISIVDTANGEKREILTRYLDPSDPSSAGILLTPPLEDNRSYLLTVPGVVDSAGRTIDSAGSSLLFEGTSVQDTVPPVLHFVSASDTVLGYPLARPLAIGFSEPPDERSLKGGILLADSSGHAVPAELIRLTPVSFLLKPEEQLSPGRRYRVTVQLDSLKDMAGNNYRDSTLVITFRSFDPNLTGEIAGTVTGLNSGGSVYVSAVRQSDELTKRVAVDSSGTFKIRFVPEGKYTLTAFEDSDGSGSYSYGLPFPFKPSERFVVGADTARVRARWAVEGIVLKFP